MKVTHYGKESNVTSGSGYFVTVTKCPDPVVTRLSINSGKMFVSRNIFIHRIFPICIPQSVPCLYFHREGRALSGTSDCDASSISVLGYDEKSTAHHTPSAGESIPLFHRNQEH